MDLEQKLSQGLNLSFILIQLSLSKSITKQRTRVKQQNHKIFYPRTLSSKVLKQHIIVDRLWKIKWLAY